MPSTSTAHSRERDAQQKHPLSSAGQRRVTTALPAVSVARLGHDTHRPDAAVGLRETSVSPATARKDVGRGHNRRHEPRPPDDAAVELGNRAPCTRCGKGLVACLRRETDLRTWDGGGEGLYWRHDRFDRVLVESDQHGGRRFWEWADENEQFGPIAAAYRQNMSDFIEEGT